MRGFRGYGHFGAGGTAPAASPIGADQFGPVQNPNPNKTRFWFTYQTPNIASLAAGAATNNAIQFDNDSIFEWTKITVYGAQATTQTGNVTNSSIVIPTVTLQILDTGTGAYYSNAPIPLSAYAGAFGLPYVMPAPQFIAPNASLQFTWSSEQTSGGLTYANLRLQLHGFKILRAGG